MSSLAIKYLEGLCTGHEDPDLWFSDSSRDEGARGRRFMVDEIATVTRAIKALAICAKCPIVDDCREIGMTDEHVDNGIWGGTLSGERIMLKYPDARDKSRTLKINFAHRVRQAQRV